MSLGRAAAAWPATAAIMALLLAKVQAVSCAAGWYSGALGAISPSTCAACGAGLYSATPGATSASTCTPCPQGTWSAATGASSAGACAPCSAGTFIELDQCKNVGKVRQCNGRLAVTHGTRDQLGDTDSPVNNRKFGVNTEMDKSLVFYRF